MYICALLVYSSIIHWWNQTTECKNDLNAACVFKSHSLWGREGGREGGWEREIANTIIIVAKLNLCFESIFHLERAIYSWSFFVLYSLLFLGLLLNSRSVCRSKAMSVLGQGKISSPVGVHVGVLLFTLSIAPCGWTQAFMQPFLLQKYSFLPGL